VKYFQDESAVFTTLSVNNLRVTLDSDKRILGAKGDLYLRETRYVLRG
jgi:hypothetical protein